MLLSAITIDADCSVAPAGATSTTATITETIMQTGKHKRTSVEHMHL